MAVLHKERLSNHLPTQTEIHNADQLRYIIASQLWLHAINRMPQDGFTLPDLANLIYGPSAGDGWRGPAGGLFSAVAMPLEWVGLLTPV